MINFKYQDHLKVIAVTGAIGFTIAKLSGSAIGTSARAGVITGLIFTGLYFFSQNKVSEVTAAIKEKVSGSESTDTASPSTAKS